MKPISEWTDEQKNGFFDMLMGNCRHKRISDTYPYNPKGSLYCDSDKEYF